eukprot:Tbor_TRINITY_DN5587_c0_g1::TRINITY_DN5587_c0_g1_i3::g.13439::m.13439
MPEESIWRRGFAIFFKLNVQHDGKLQEMKRSEQVRHDGKLHEWEKRNEESIIINKRGGEIQDALSNDDLDSLFKQLGLKAYNSLLTKTRGEELKNLNINERFYGALHFKFHWIGAAFTRRSNSTLEVVIFDSAPCNDVHTEIKRWLKTVEQTVCLQIALRVRTTPRQVRFSNECGIHVLRNCVRFDMPEEEMKVKSLNYLRKPLEKLLITHCTRLKRAIIRDMKGIESLRKGLAITGAGVTIAPPARLSPDKPLNVIQLDRLVLRVMKGVEVDCFPAAMMKGRNNRHFLKRLQKGRKVCFLLTSGITGCFA